MKEENRSEFAPSRRLLDFARLFRFLMIAAILVAIVVLPSLQLYLTLGAIGLLFPLAILVASALVIGLASFRLKGNGEIKAHMRKKPSPSEDIFERRRIVISEYGLYPAGRVSRRRTAEKAVEEQLREEGATEISRQRVIRGVRTSHRPDLVFKIGEKECIAEIKARPLVPSDIDNALRVLQDIKFRGREVHAVLFTPRDPPARVSEMANSKNIEIRVLPELEDAGIFRGKPRL